MAITKKEIDEIKSRLEKASPGPWRVASTTDGEYILDRDDCVVAATFERKEDAYFVTHAREDIPRLVEEVERLREEMESLRESIEYALGYAKFVNKIVWLVQHDEELEDAVRDLKSFIEGSEGSGE